MMPAHAAPQAMHAAHMGGVRGRVDARSPWRGARMPLIETEGQARQQAHAASQAVRSNQEQAPTSDAVQDEALIRVRNLCIQVALLVPATHAQATLCCWAAAARCYAA